MPPAPPATVAARPGRATDAGRATLAALASRAALTSSAGHTARACHAADAALAGLATLAARASRAAVAASAALVASEIVTYPLGFAEALGERATQMTADQRAVAFVVLKAGGAHAAHAGDQKKKENGKKPKQAGK